MHSCEFCWHAATDCSHLFQKVVEEVREAEEPKSMPRRRRVDDDTVIVLPVRQKKKNESPVLFQINHNER